MAATNTNITGIAIPSVITRTQDEAIPSKKQPQSLIPELRFKEFDEEWDIIKSSIQIVAGNAYALNDYVDTGIILVQGLNISPGMLKLDSPYFINESLDVNHIDINKGDILIGLNRPVINGELKICKYTLKEKAYLYQRAGKLKFNSKEISSEFLYQLLRSAYFLKKISNELVGSDQPYIRSNLFKVIKLNFPHFPEQQQIATFLSIVDTKINQLSKKKDLLEQYKKVVMQQFFHSTGSGQVTGELRFKDEQGNDYPDWEEKFFKEIVLEYRLGGNYTNTEEETIYPLIKMGNLGRGRINLKKLEYIPVGEDINPKDKIEYGDLVFNTRNTLDLVGKVSIWRNELPAAYYNSNLMYLRFDNNFFMNYRLNSYEGMKGLKRFATGTTSVAAIYTKDLLKLKLSIPCLEEQQKIATFLSNIDTKIESVNQQIIQTQNFKKGLLQKMFV